ncbi:MAG: HAMP domain-containing histidine kinase [Bacteroidales bacterium]|nr:HAMP domain-containing histidine kinase [Bacteroidales bacterium]
MNDNLKKTIVCTLILFCLFLIYYFHYIIKSDVVFTHLFYLPIVISAIWWKRTAIFIAVLLGLALIISQLFSGGGIALTDVLRALMFIFIASLASYSLDKNKKYLLKIVESEKLIEASKIIITKTEEVKSQNEELKKLNADKDRFIFILAHDLKSPFNSMLGFLELLSVNIRKYDIDEIEKQINIVNNAARNTFQLLEDLLMWVRTQSGKIPYKPQKLNFSDICMDIVAFLKPNASAKNITINHFVAEKITVFADINMLKTILRNLISNAIKFTNPGGRIDIYTVKTQSNITISVSDNGVGIAPEILNKLFDISQTHTTKGTINESGTGLGLFLCNEFVRKHGGKIRVESEVGKGSNFEFTLPLYKKQNIEPAKQSLLNKIKK